MHRLPNTADIGGDCQRHVPYTFGTELDDEYRRLASTFGRGVDLAALALAGIDTSLLVAGVKRTLSAEVDPAAGDAGARVITR